MLRLLLCCSFFLMIAPEMLAIHPPVLKIKTVKQPVEFTGKRIVLLKKGDSVKYKNADYDDSSWKKVSLPHNWDKIYPGHAGFAWYRLHVAIPEENFHCNYGLRFGIICNSEDVYINGHLIKNNIIDGNEYYGFNRVRIYEIPRKFLLTDQKSVISVRTRGLFTYMNGPYLDKFIFGSHEKLLKDFFKEELIDFTLILLYLFSSFFFLLFSITYPQFKEYIILSLLTLFSGIYFFTRSQLAYMYIDSVDLIKDFEYIAIFMIFILVMEFITRFVDYKHFWLHYVFYGYTGLNIILFVVIQDRLLLSFLLKYFVQPSWLIPIIFTIIMIFRNVKYIKDIGFLAGASVMMSLFVLHDVLSSQGISPLPFLSKYGFFFFNISLVIITFRRTITVRVERDELKESLSKRRTKTVTDQIRKALDESIEIINKNFKEIIERDELATNWGMSGDYFGKMFKRYTGLPLNDFINQKRVQYTVDELNNSDKSITEIAFEAGFESMPTFYRSFQKCTGKSPGDYRKNGSPDDQ